MIKVNLLRSQLNNPVQQPAMGMGSGPPTAFQKPEVRDALVKGAAVAICTVGLIVYENQTVHVLQQERAQMQNHVVELETNARTKAAEVDAVKDVAKQARELEDKLKILKLLSKLRLREVKTLDFVQSSIPEKVWLKTMTYEADKEKVEAGHFNFTGAAVATEDLTEFVKRLEDSAYLYEVIVMKNQEVGNNQKNILRDFQFTAQVEVKP